MYLNVYGPTLQYPSGVASFLRNHRGHKYASSVLLEPISSEFVTKMEKFADECQIQVITFPKGLRKDDLAKAALAEFTKAGRTEGVLSRARRRRRRR